MTSSAQQRVTWRFWRGPNEIRNLRRVNLNLMRRNNELHERCGVAEGWIDKDGYAVIAWDRLFPQPASSEEPT